MGIGKSNHGGRFKLCRLSVRETEGIYGSSVPLGPDIVVHPCQNRKAYSKGSFGGFTESLPVLVENLLAALHILTLTAAAKAGKERCHDDCKWKRTVAIKRSLSHVIPGLPSKPTTSNVKASFNLLTTDSDNITSQKLSIHFCLGAEMRLCTVVAIRPWNLHFYPLPLRPKTLTFSFFRAQRLRSCHAQAQGDSNVSDNLTLGLLRYLLYA
jgi:hypothetical protein